MKLIGSLFLVVALIFGTTTLAPVDSPLSLTQEAHAHTWQQAGGVSPYAWCDYTATFFGFRPDYFIWNAGMIHYGAPHVYICTLRSYYDYGSFNYVCMQQVEWYGWGDLDWWYPLQTGQWCAQFV